MQNSCFILDVTLQPDIFTKNNIRWLREQIKTFHHNILRSF